MSATSAMATVAPNVQVRVRDVARLSARVRRRRGIRARRAFRFLRHRFVDLSRHVAPPSVARRR